MIGRLLCRIGLHHWTPPRADGYERSKCERCGTCWRHDWVPEGFADWVCSKCGRPR